MWCNGSIGALGSPFPNELVKSAGGKAWQKASTEKGLKTASDPGSNPGIPITFFF